MIKCETCHGYGLFYSPAGDYDCTECKGTGRGVKRKNTLHESLVKVLKEHLAELRANAYSIGFTDADMMKALNWGPYRLKRTFERPTRLRHVVKLMSLLGVRSFISVEVE